MFLVEKGEQVQGKTFPVTVKCVKIEACYQIKYF